MAENTNPKPRAKRTDAAPAAPAKPRRSRAAKPAAPEVVATVDDGAEARRALAMPKVVDAEGWVGQLRAAVEAGDAEAARSLADQLAGAARGVKAVYGRRKGAPPRPRTVPGQGEYVIVVQGRIVKDSAYKPSVARDIAVAKKGGGDASMNVKRAWACVRVDARDGGRGSA